MKETDSGHKIFLLSPANLSGVRAAQLAAPEARFAAARQLRSPEGVPIEQAFTFCSSLYFRGKIAYARRFAAPPPELPELGALVIAPGFGFVLPDWPLTLERMAKLQKTPVDVRSRAYTRPMREQAEALAAHLDGIASPTRVVLLGSIATGKYVDLLLPALGERLVFPTEFVGQGDMRRGALMLRAAREGGEMEYSTLDGPRRGRRGPRVETLG
jgi:hypothetical protein